MRSARNQNGSRRNKKHARRSKQPRLRLASDYRKWYPGGWSALLATPNQVPSSTSIDEVFGPIGLAVAANRGPK